MADASTSTSEAAERLARLVQRLRRLVRGEPVLTGGSCRLQPQDEADVATALELARELRIPVSFGRARPVGQTAWWSSSPASAGGTPAIPAASSEADVERPAPSSGQGGGLQIDAGAHLARAARFDGTRGLIEVQPGVRLADLNRLLQPHGWWLPIETCPDSGATLGGLAGLDAAAAAPGWGTLADRLLGIDAILDDGTRQLFGPFGERSSVSLTSGRAGQLVSALFDIAAHVQADIARHWPPGRRVPDGYLLDVFHPRPQRPYTPDGTVNLAHLLAGSAGTLAWSARLHLRLLRRPAASRWALFVQPSAVAALAHAPAVLALQPSAALLLDAADLLRLVVSSHPDDRALCRVAREQAGPAAWLVRFSGESDAGVRAGHRRLAALLDPLRQEGADGLPVGAEGGMAVWRQLLGELVSPALPCSTAPPLASSPVPARSASSPKHCSRLVAIPLPPQEPAALAGLVSALDDRLATQGMCSAWRGQVAAGELQWQVPEAAVPLARQALAAILPPRWSPALRQAFAEVRRQFDPAGILWGGH